MRKVVFILLLMCSLRLMAQMECEVQITPNDTTFYTNNDTTITLSLSEEGTSQPYLISWQTNGENTLNISDSLHPTLFVSPSSTAIVEVDAMFLSEENLVPNGDFELGNTGFYSALQYVGTTGNRALWNEGTYAVGTNPHNYHESWINATHDGKMLIANGATDPGRIVYQTTINVQPYTDYVVKFEAANVDNGATSANVARFQFSIDGQMVGDIFSLSQTVFEWHEYYQIWTSGANTTATITIVNQNITGGGNDFAIDNVEVRELCNAYDMITINSIATNYDTIIENICEGEMYEFRGITFDTSVFYNDTVMEENTCNITTLILTVNPLNIKTIKDSICRGEKLVFYDQLLTTPGTYTYIKHNDNECDSLITLNLTVLATFVDTVIAEICEGEVYKDNNFSENKSGLYTKEYLSADGCPSSVTLVLTVNPAYHIEYKEISTTEEPYTEHGFYAEQTGTYVQELQTVKGCDSILTLYYKVDRPLIIYTENAFMPMNDNEQINRFRIIPNSEDVQIYRFQIFDRWGTLMYESDDIKEGWDGKYKNQFCPQGVYVYHLLYYSKFDPTYVKDYTGEFMLIY